MPLAKKYFPYIIFYNVAPQQFERHKIELLKELNIQSDKNLL